METILDMHLSSIFPSHEWVYPSEWAYPSPAKKDLLMLTILLIILILALLGVLPTWPYSHAWGYYPSGGLGILLIIVIILMLL